MIRWLTVSDLAIELGMEPKQIVRLWKSGQLKGVGDTEKSLRIVDPGPELAAQLHNRNLDYFQFITTQEIAEVLGVTYPAMRKRLERERRANPKHGLHPSGGVIPKRVRERHTHQRFFNRLEVRRYFAMLEKRSGQTKYQYSDIIMRWLRAWLAMRETPVMIIDELIHKVVDSVPDPDRSRIAGELWSHFDAVNELLRECERKCQGKGGAPCEIRTRDQET